MMQNSLFNFFSSALAIFIVFFVFSYWSRQMMHYAFARRKAKLVEKLSEASNDSTSVSTLKVVPMSSDASKTEKM